MNNRIRTIGIILFGALLLTTTACSSGAQNSDVTTDEGIQTQTSENVVTEEPNRLFQVIEDDLDDSLDFGGEVFNIISRCVGNTIYEISVPEADGDVVNDAVFERERAVEERLNCKIENMAVGNDWHGADIMETVTSAILSGDSTYDILANSNYGSTPKYEAGYFMNLYDVENLNLEKEYWAQHLISNTAINDQLFGISGSLSLYMYQSVFAMFFNRDLCTQYDINPDELFQMVEDGKWTLDTMIEMTRNVYSDANGNGEKDTGDVYGFGLDVCASTDGYWTSCQIDMTEWKDGTLVFEPDLVKLTDVVEKLRDFAYNQPGVIRTCEWDGDASGSYMPNAFPNDQFLFMNGRIMSVSSGAFRDMKSDYGIIPYPKYDEEQSGYYSYLHDGFTVFSVPTTVRNSAQVGALLEAMACDSHNRVIPTYYEKALTTKYARDEQSVNCLQTIFSNVYLDTGWLYSSNMAGAPQATLREIIWYNQSGIASKIESCQKQANKLLKDMVESFQSISEQ